MIIYDVYVVEKRSRKVMTLNEQDIMSLIRERAHLLFPNECLSVVATVKTIDKEA
jgi:hypothetical protein